MLVYTYLNVQNGFGDFRKQHVEPLGSVFGTVGDSLGSHVLFSPNTSHTTHCCNNHKWAVDTAGHYMTKKLYVYSIR